jgi:hypothetical protein
LDERGGSAGSFRDVSKENEIYLTYSEPEDFVRPRAKQLFARPSDLAKLG